jgi:hypothetical protein
MGMVLPTGDIHVDKDILCSQCGKHTSGAVQKLHGSLALILCQTLSWTLGLPNVFKIQVLEVGI